MAEATDKPIPVLTPENRDKARELAALAALEQLLEGARKQKDFVSWRAMGCPELESLLRALRTGSQHPALRRWEQLKVTDAKSTAPDPLDLTARRLTLLMVETLRRVGVGEGMARARAVNALNRKFPTTKNADTQATRPLNRTFPTTKEAIRGWRRDYPGITEGDEKTIAKVIKDHGHSHEQIMNWFILNILTQIDSVAVRTARYLPPER
jgi:hypothetical protein